MFNNKKDNENNFCESYKSEILGTVPRKKEGSLFSTIVKLLTILMLLAIIIGVSFYGYNYFMKNQERKNIALPPVSMQISDDDLVVEAEDPIEEKVIIREENTSLPTIISPQLEELDIDKIANDVKIAISISELKEENKTKVEEKVLEEIKNTEELNGSSKGKSLEVPTSSPEAQYLEELADLSKEIDKERKK